MANDFIQAQTVVDAAMLLLQREIVLPQLVWRQADENFRFTKDDTFTLRVPAVLDARTRAMRDTGGALQADDLAETSVDVTLDTHIYQLLKVTDEQLTLDVRDFAAQVLAPQMRAVAEGLEDVIATAITGATWDADPVDFAEGSDEPFDVAVDCRKALNDLNVPRTGRVLLLGSSVEAAFLKSEAFRRVDQSGTDSALRDATIGRAAGFAIVGSNAIDPDKAYAMHQTAIAFGNVAPALPDGATMKARTTSNGFSLRYLRDYDPTNSTGPVDRSLVDAYVGATSVEEDSTNKRGVEINFTPAGS